MFETAVVVLWFSSIVVSPVVASPQDVGCEGCHPAQAVAEKDSAHHSAVSCSGCHGGDPTAETREAAHDTERGYTGVLGKKEIAELCGTCHADVARMNPYGLPTDQLKRYRLSHHGERLFDEDDLAVAVCSDCHGGGHGIISAAQPASPVHPTHVADTCGRCHADESLMEEHDLAADQLELYRQSIHAEMLYEQGDLSAPTCVTCHGSHGAVPPGFASVGLVCGKCHIKQKEHFEQSPHAEEAADGGFEPCVTCHRNHEVQRATDVLYNLCQLCHEEETPAWTVMETTRSLIAETRQRYEQIQGALRAAARAGFVVDDETVLLDEARTYMTQLAPEQHALNVDRLQELSTRTGDVLEDVQQRLASKREAERLRQLALVPISIFCLFMAVVFWRKRSRIVARDEKRHERELG